MISSDQRLIKDFFDEDVPCFIYVDWSVAKLTEKQTYENLDLILLHWKYKNDAIFRIVHHKRKCNIMSLLIMIIADNLDYPLIQQYYNYIKNVIDHKQMIVRFAHRCKTPDKIEFYFWFLDMCHARNIDLRFVVYDEYQRNRIDIALKIVHRYNIDVSIDNFKLISDLFERFCINKKYILQSRYGNSKYILRAMYTIENFCQSVNTNGKCKCYIDNIHKPDYVLENLTMEEKLLTKQIFINEITDVRAAFARSCVLVILIF